MFSITVTSSSSSACCRCYSFFSSGPWYYAEINSPRRQEVVSLSQLLARALLAAESGIFFGTFPQVILSNKQRCTLGKNNV